MEHYENFQESVRYKNRNLYQEKVKIDGKKLKQILNDSNESTQSGCLFFNKIMMETSTNILWPSKSVLDTIKFKKDVNIEIYGDKNNVLVAKERILKILPPKNDRVTMKMEISYTDHSHIIGKSGLSIKRVMEETQCHVHFPDSNRYNLTKKNNQVSITGDLDCVELARKRLRKLIPLIFGFEPSIFGQIIDNKDEFIQKLQNDFNVQVIFKTRSKLNATIVLVKGDEWELERVKEATINLMKYICKDDNIPVQMTLQISPQFHQIVLGTNYVHLKTIMQYTETKILIPDVQDMNISDLKKDNISISGSINNVYLARQLLMGNLPLQIIFELSDIGDLSECNLNKIQTICNVTINLYQRNKQNYKTCVIKGIEREANSIYKARKLILGIDKLPIITENNNNCVQYPMKSPIVEGNSSNEWLDIVTLLNYFGLEQYVMLFVQEEIDLEIFSTFNDNDLIALGVNTFENRKRMLMAINELNKQSRPFPLAPGAERKKLSTHLFP